MKRHIPLNDIKQNKTFWLTRVPSRWSTHLKLNISYFFVIITTSLWIGHLGNRNKCYYRKQSAIRTASIEFVWHGMTRSPPTGLSSNILKAEYHMPHHFPLFKWLQFKRISNRQDALLHKKRFSISLLKEILIPNHILARLLTKKRSDISFVWLTFQFVKSG